MAERRWPLRNTQYDIEERDVDLRFLAQIGEYDILYDAIGECYTVVKERPVGAGRRYNFTDYNLVGGNLVPADKDVELDPYHMCLLYQLHEEIGHDLTFDIPT
jgi:hypothetical protein